MWLCLACNKEIDPQDPRISDSSHPYYGACPECGERGIPADLAERLTISITWHELRVLCIWAERWAGKAPESERAFMLRTVYGIADRIQMQHLDQKVGLTFRSELAELSGMGLKYEQNVIPEDEPPAAST